MLRATLVAYMLLLSLTGPDPCCCTLVRFAMMSTAWGRTSDDSSVPKRGCCCRRLVANDRRDLRGLTWLGLLSSNSSGTNDCCHCKKNLCQAAPSENVPFASARTDLEELILDSACLHLLSVSLGDAEVHPRQEPPRLRPSGREIRIRMCSWHC
jgi:hypothetical protein